MLYRHHRIVLAPGAQIVHCDLDYEIENARLLSAIVETRLSIPQVSDVRRLLDDGNRLICNVNARNLNGEEGYAGHFGTFRR